MKRRKFLKNISKLSSTPLILNGIGLSPFASPSMLQMLTTCTGIEERTIVVLFLKGGNDGLNTLLPVDQYSTYIGHRPNIGLAESGNGAYVNLDTTLDIADQVGIHPSAISFKDMYESGKARLIQSVGYPSFNQSHFKSTDLWLGGGDGTAGGANDSGWIGRFFENAYPSIHGNPNTQYPDPLGVQFGDTKASLSFHDCTSTYEGVNLSGQDPGNLFGLLNGLGTAPHETPIDSEFGEEIDYIMSIENSTNVYGQRITEVYNAGMNSSTVYPDSNLANQLATVARLMAGGSQTKMFLTHKGNFDTHAGQIVEGNTSTGWHATLLEDVFDSVKAFHNDITNLGLGQKVVTVVFSEFARRITENGSFGCDHGNYGPMFVFGDGINPGISGTNFDLTNINSSGNMNSSELQYDYRDVFKTLLQDWMGAGSDILDPAQFGPFNILPDLIEDAETVDPSCYIAPVNPLPIELSSFEVRLNNEKEVEIDWSTFSEIDMDFFEIERMQNGGEREIIDRVQAQGNSSIEQYYDSLDPNPPTGTSLYRLRSVDLDGKEDWSDWKAIEIKEQLVQGLKIYPNPAIYDFNLVLTTGANRNLMMEIFTMTGQRVHGQDLQVLEGFNKFRVDVSDFPVGQYTVKVSGEGMEVEHFNLMVHRQ